MQILGKKLLDKSVDILKSDLPRHGHGYPPVRKGLGSGPIKF
jgi:hypothetical protein